MGTNTPNMKIVNGHDALHLENLALDILYVHPAWNAFQ